MDVRVGEEAPRGTIEPAATLDGVSIDFLTSKGVVHAVKRLSMIVPKGRRVGFIGESGSGKTTTALAIMGLLAGTGRVAEGSIRLGDTEMLRLSDKELRAARLSRVAYIPQGAMNSLNPIMRIEEQLWDAIRTHEPKTPTADLKRRSDAAFESVGLASHVGQLYPHELSGGMKQRVCIALGVVLSPELIIADEPTSALDVVTQKQVMHTLKAVQERIGSGLILIGHDMGLMAQSVDELAVLKDGELVEMGSVRQIIEAPRHPYTKRLISSVPLVGGPSFLDTGAVPPVHERLSSEPLLAFEGVTKSYGSITALHPMTFALDGTVPQIISVVGQSGSGKSTMGGLMLGFNEPSTGTVRFDGRDVAALPARERLDYRKKVQAVFQDPYACFNPFYRVDRALRYPFKRFGLSGDVNARMREACEAVGLDPDLVLHRYPHELSGGQRQRLIVARALMLSPRLLIADEPVSMVDASLRATILKNIHDLKERYGISIVYITHDLATAYHVSDYVLVLYKGRVVEAGPPREVIGDPQHPYTRLLIDSIPWPDLDRAWGDPRSDGETEAMEREIEASTETVVRGRIEGFTLGV